MKKIEITDYQIIKTYYDKYKVEASEISFTNLFMWRNKYNFHFEIVHDFLWVVNIKDENTFYYSQPIGDYSNKIALDKSIHTVMDKQHESGKKFILKKCDKLFLETIKMLNINHTFVEKRDDFDYVYDYEELKILEGKKYHKKKNHLNKFLKTYDDWSYYKMDSSNLSEVLTICDKWFANAVKENDAELLSELSAIKEAINNFNELDYSGGIIQIDNKPRAFILGERLNDETLLIHIEKADINYKGIYPMIFYQYIHNQDTDYKYINREQDLGIAGLRKSKLSYHPVKFIEKYQIEITR